MGSAGKRKGEKYHCWTKVSMLNTAVLLHWAVSPRRGTSEEWNSWWWEAAGHPQFKEVCFRPAVLWSPHSMVAGAHQSHSWCIFCLTEKWFTGSIAEWTEVWSDSDWERHSYSTGQGKCRSSRKGLCSEGREHADMFGSRVLLLSVAISKCLRMGFAWLTIASF